jgi:hypothetical protein
LKNNEKIMPKLKSQINCPQCRQLIPAEIEQVLDTGADRSAKTRFLAGQYNIVNCPHCGFHGNLATPLVYHDPDKELLLTFIPPELNLPMAEQERTIGKLINKVLEGLPKEKRKGYLLNLQEEGITKEVIEAQQKRAALIQRLVTITDDEALAHVVKEEDQNIDAQFFAMLSQLVDASLSRNDQANAEKFSQLQQRLLPISTFGKELQAQSEELEAAINELRGLGKEVTREKLLDLVLAAKSEKRIDAYASLARMGMDYQFFQLLSEKIEAAEGEEKKRLEGIRSHLLEVVETIDKEMQARMEIAKKNLETLIGVEDIRETTIANLAAIDEYFLEVLNQEYAAAKQNKDGEREGKLKQVIETISEISQAAAGPDPELVQSLLDAKDSEARQKIMEEHAEEITPRFVEAMSTLLVQLEGPENLEKADKVRAVYRDAVRFSMQAQMKAGKQEEKKS